MIRHLPGILARPALVCAIVFASTGLHAHGWGRHALLFGNADYAEPLLNPVNDARSLGGELQRLGFAVKIIENSDRAAMQAALRTFAIDARNAEVALVYYAGHGAQAAQNGYVLPIGSRLQTLNADSIMADGIAIDRLIGDVQRTNANVGLLIIDACRDVHMRGTAPQAIAHQGLPASPTPSGMVVAYSTAPGARARDYWSADVPNSPYTAALVNALAQPGLQLGDVFAQVAEDVSRTTRSTQKPYVAFGDTAVRLVLNDTPVPAVAAVTPPTPAVASNRATATSGTAAPDRAGPVTMATYRWPPSALQDMQHEVMSLLAAPDDAALQTRAARDDALAQTALAMRLARDGATDGAHHWFARAAAADFPMAQAELAGLLIARGDAASLAQARTLLNASDAAGYLPARAYRADLARRTPGNEQEALGHMLDAFQGFMGGIKHDVDNLMITPPTLGR